MIEAPMPQDILQYRAKFIGNFSAREAVCTGLGLIVGFVTAFTVFNQIEITQIKIFCSGLCAFPFFAIGFIKIYDQPLEKVGWVMLKDNLISPQKRLKEIHYDDFEKWKKENPESEPDKKNKKKDAQKKNKAKSSNEWIGVK